MSRNQEQESRRVLVVSQRTLNAVATRRRFLAGTAGLGAASLLGRSAFASPARNAAYQRQAAQEELSIIIGTLGEANTINPFLSSDAESNWRCKMLFDEFVRANPTTYAVEPGIASEWTLDNLTFTFTIRPEATFSDGSQLTAEDVAFTINGLLAKATGSPNQAKFASIDGADAVMDGSATEASGIKVVDPQTLQVTLAKPDAPFIFNLRYLWIVPKAKLEGQDLANGDFFQTPIGAGPYKFESWTSGSDFVAVANEHYWQAEKPAIKRLTHRLIADSQSLVLALQGNEIDASNYPNPAGQDLLAQNTDLDLMAPPFSSGNGWYFNCRDGVLADKNVRRAIAMSLDCEQFAADSLLGLGKAAVGPIAPDNWAFDKSLQPIPYDPTTAKTMIDEAGAAGSQIEFAVNSGNIFREDWLTYTQSALKDVGIEVVPQLVDYATHVDAVQKNHDFQVSGVDFAGATSEPNKLWEDFHSTSAGNFSGYSNPELDDLLDQARTTLDQEEAKPIFAKIQKIIIDDVPMHFAWYRPFLHAVNKTKFANYVDSGDFGLFSVLEDWTSAQP